MASLRPGVVVIVAESGGVVAKGWIVPWVRPLTLIRGPIRED